MLIFPRKRGTYENDRSPAMGRVGRETGWACFRICVDTKEETIRTTVAGETAEEACILTDENRSYLWLENEEEPRTRNAIDNLFGYVAMFGLAFNHDEITPVLLQRICGCNSIPDLTRANCGDFARPGSAKNRPSAPLNGKKKGGARGTNGTRETFENEGDTTLIFRVLRFEWESEYDV